jgi:hypothetical protein
MENEVLQPKDYSKLQQRPVSHHDNNYCIENDRTFECRKTRVTISVFFFIKVALKIETSDSLILFLPFY